MVQKRNLISRASCGKFIDLFSKLKALRTLYSIGPWTEVNMVLFLRNKQFYATRFFVWLPIEVVEITNWGARIPQNTFGWRWLPIEDFCTPPSCNQRNNGFLWRVLRRKIYSISTSSVQSKYHTKIQFMFWKSFLTNCNFFFLRRYICC